MTEPLAPLVPADCDLRGLPWMPIDTVRLLDSDLFALATGEEFKAAVALWCKAWQQVPASSLPEDDRVLAHLSGAGTRWKKVKEQALRGFVRCSDGRLYHPVIAEKALEAWGHRKAQRVRAAKRWDRHGNATASPPEHATAHATASPTAMQGTGTGQGQEIKTPAASQLASSPAASPPAVGEGMNGHDPSDAVVERIPLVGGVEFEVRQSLVAELDRLYPAVEPVQTLREIRGWCLGNPSRRKTARGVKAFITNWFSREQNKPQRVN